MRLRWRDVTLLVAFPCFIALGQILFKLTAAHGRGRPAGEAIAAVVVQPVFYSALAIYAFGTLLWIWILSRYSLTLAYPFAAIALVIVPLLEMAFFGVRGSPGYWLGLCMIVSGVLLVTRSRVSAPAPAGAKH
jgi:undecaprenyl phosphate-alpha-L-ara4N flippase subunit ArnE